MLKERCIGLSDFHILIGDCDGRSAQSLDLDLDRESAKVRCFPQFHLHGPAVFGGDGDLLNLTGMPLQRLGSHHVSFQSLAGLENTKRKSIHRRSTIVRASVGQHDKRVARVKIRDHVIAIEHLRSHQVAGAVDVQLVDVSEQAADHDGGELGKLA